MTIKYPLKSGEAPLACRNHKEMEKLPKYHHFCQLNSSINS
jgi:hypothetical protein